MTAVDPFPRGSSESFLRVYDQLAKPAFAGGGQKAILGVRDVVAS
jgi:hypothetical protein